MRSIRQKIIALILLSILSSALLISSVSVLNINQEEEYASIQIINSICRELAANLNSQIDTLERSVNSVAKIADDEVGTDWEEFLATMQLMLEDIAEETENSVAYYLYLDPAITGKQMGLVATRENDSFILKKPKTFQMISEPVWTEPYDSEISDLHVISYIVPLESNGNTLGIIGMDIDFHAFCLPVQAVSVYENGYAYLMDDYGKVYYHPVLEEGTIPSETTSTLPEVLDRFLEQDNGEELITYYSYAGIERKTAFVKLHNGMDVVISADSSDIYIRRNDLLRKTLLIVLLVAAIWVITTIIITQRITKPLIQLTAAAEEISQGRLDVKLPNETNDEVGTLTRTFRITIQYLKRYISDINALAYRDVLTNVKNKTAYQQMVDAENDRMKYKQSQFAIVVLDANGLKQINDQLGHAQGDLYLQNICHLICSIFKRSPVYRIGGDEFVIWLENEDYEDRNKLIQELENAMEKSLHEKDPANQVSIAFGISEARSSDSSVQMVFDRADAAMYQKKQEMKTRWSVPGR